MANNWLMCHQTCSPYEFLLQRSCTSTRQQDRQQAAPPSQKLVLEQKEFPGRYTTRNRSTYITQVSSAMDQTISLLGTPPALFSCRWTLTRPRRARSERQPRSF